MGAQREAPLLQRRRHLPRARVRRAKCASLRFVSLSSCLQTEHAHDTLPLRLLALHFLRGDLRKLVVIHSRYYPDLLACEAPLLATSHCWQGLGGVSASVGGVAAALAGGEASVLESPFSAARSARISSGMSGFAQLTLSSAVLVYTGMAAA